MPITIVNRTEYDGANLGFDTFAIPATSPGNMLVLVSNIAGANAYWAPSPPINYIEDNISDPLQPVPKVVANPAVNGNANVFLGLDVYQAYWVGNTTNSVDVWYGITAGGATSISFNSSSDPSFTVYELSGGGCTIALDDVQGTGYGPGGGTQAIVPPPLNGTGTDNFYIQAIGTQFNAVTAVDAAWTAETNVIWTVPLVYKFGVGAAPLPIFTEGATTPGVDRYTILAVSFKLTSGLCGCSAAPSGNPYAGLNNAN